MFLTQHFVPRWKKEWLPLATQQLRLRNLIKILAYSIENDDKERVGSKMNNASDSRCLINKTYYFTLHATTMSAPFYTSEKLRSESPKWKELEISSWEGSVCNSVDAVVVRLWMSNSQNSEDKVLAVWGVYFSGLMYLGPSLREDLPLKPNSIIFLMSGGYFTDPQCLESNIKIRYSSVIVKNCDARQSYSVSSLKRLQTLQLVIRKEVAEAEMLKKNISMGDFFRSENRGRTTLRKLLSKHKPKRNRVDLIRVKESIEITKYRVKILKEEKEIMLQRLKELNKHIKSVSDSNQTLESKILENYRILKKEIYSHREWKRGYIDRREKYLHSKAMLNFRTKQLISELNLIYPIVEVSSEKFTICGVHLPNSEDFAGHDDLQISIALGFVTHIIQMISVFLQIPLRYPVIHYGSRSRIIDEITDKIPDSEREFCLYIKGKEKLQFHYAVYLLNKNIAQMRWLCGLPTSDLRNTLENLSFLVKLKFENSTLDQSCRSLSSSTADIGSSNVSVSSPLGSAMSFQSKKYLKTHYISDTGTDVCISKVTSLSLHVPKHRISKSVGSSKDFMTNLLSTKKKKSVNDKETVKNTLSCSLDKGLNEYEETLNMKKNEIEQFASEPLLSHSNKIQKNLESEATGKFLKSWKTESEKVPFSDDDLEIEMNFDLSPRKEENLFCNDTSSRDEFKGCNALLIEGESSINSVAETNALGNQTKMTKKLDLMEYQKKNTLSDETPSLNNDKKIGNIKDNCQGITDNIKKCDKENSILMGDALLESVTNRTEALVHQTTSFNRFRTRFRSTLESSD